MKNTELDLNVFIAMKIISALEEKIEMRNIKINDLKKAMRIVSDHESSNSILLTLAEFISRERADIDNIQKEIEVYKKNHNIIWGEREWRLLRLKQKTLWTSS